MFNSLVPFTKHLKDMDSLFNHMFDENFFGNLSSPMRVNVKENGDQYTIEAELPGLNKDQIHLNYENGYLTIVGKQQNDIQKQEQNFITHERHAGQISRSFYVGNVNKEDIVAKYENGILTISLPKTQALSEAKRIPIQ